MNFKVSKCIKCPVWTTFPKKWSSKPLGRNSQKKLIPINGYITWDLAPVDFKMLCFPTFQCEDPKS